MRNSKSKPDRSEEAMKRKRKYNATYHKEHYQDMRVCFTAEYQEKMDLVREYCKIRKIPLGKFIPEAAFEKLQRELADSTDDPTEKTE